MSSIWTPGGEHPVEPEREPPPGASDTAGPAAGAPDGEQLEAELAEVQRQLAETPVEVVVANHAVGLFQLAVLHLNQPQPDLDEARLAVDAMGALVEGLGDRLGEQAPALRDALAQLRLGYVQVVRRQGGTAGDTNAGAPDEPGGSEPAGAG